MAYTNPAFKTKKELKAAIKAGETVRVKSAAFFEPNQDGDEWVEGPEGKPHTWYAHVKVEQGRIVRVVS